MDFLIFVLYFLVIVLALSLWANLRRNKRNYKFDLEPNCLLTRWNVLFITGPRSFFYFSRYWNIYPVYLAEHGYEVFTLHLPWNKPYIRIQRFKEFLRTQSELKRHFHLVFDSTSLIEFQEMLRSERPACVASVTEIADHDADEVVMGLSPFPMPFARISTIKTAEKGPWTLSLAYDLHRLFNPKRHLSSAATLGAIKEVELQNSKLLLERVRTLAEMDLQDGH